MPVLVNTNDTCHSPFMHTILSLYRRASEALDNASQQLKHLAETPVVLTVKGIGHFRNNVVFAQIEEENIADLQNIAGRLNMFDG